MAYLSKFKTIRRCNPLKSKQILFFFKCENAKENSKRALRAGTKYRLKDCQQKSFPWVVFTPFLSLSQYSNG